MEEKCFSEKWTEQNRLSETVEWKGGGLRWSRTGVVGRMSRAGLGMSKNVRYDEVARLSLVLFGCECSQSC